MIDIDNDRNINRDKLPDIQPEGLVTTILVFIVIRIFFRFCDALLYIEFDGRKSET